MLLGYLLILGALAVGLCTGKGLVQTAALFVQGLLDPATLQLMGVITLIERITIFLQEYLSSGGPAFGHLSLCLVVVFDSLPLIPKGSSGYFIS